MDEEQFHVLTTTCGTPGYMAPEIFRKSGHGKPVDVWAIGVITYFLLCGYTPFDRDSNLEEMQAILEADYSFTPIEYWRGVSQTARQFIKQCLTIDPNVRMTAHQALSHEWIAGPATGRGVEDLLPTVKKNFNARQTLHKAIDTVRAINQLRSGGLGMVNAAAKAKDTQGDTKMGDADDDSRPRGLGQTDAQIAEQQRKIEQTMNGLWSGKAQRQAA